MWTTDQTRSSLINKQDFATGTEMFDFKSPILFSKTFILKILHISEFGIENQSSTFCKFL